MLIGWNLSRSHMLYSDRKQGKKERKKKIVQIQDKSND